MLVKEALDPSELSISETDGPVCVRVRVCACVCVCVRVCVCVCVPQEEVLIYKPSLHVFTHLTKVVSQYEECT